MAVPTISGPVDEDLYFERGVLIEGVSDPSNPEATSGSSSVTIEGVGTVTVADTRIGSFPRIMISGGTTITSKRTWDADVMRKTWWEGQFSAPSSGRLPSYDKIKFPPGLQKGDGSVIVDAFLWGLANETFSYSPSAAVVLPVNESDGVRLWVAYPQSNEDWEIKSEEFCFVQDGLCALEVSDANSLALIKESFSKCPKTSVENGTVGRIPNCIIDCDRGFELSEDGSSCLTTKFDEFEDEEFDEVSEEFEEEDILEETKAPDIRGGYIRYRGSRAQIAKTVDEGSVEPDELERARKIDAAKSVRAPDETEEEQVSDQDDGFLNYILQIRDRYEDHNVNDFTIYDEAKKKDVQTIEKEEPVHGSAPLLPSTGPEIFAALAVIGIILMIIGVARKKN